MDLKTLHTADRIRHALAGNAILTKSERDDAVLALIAKVERCALFANSAHSRRFCVSEKLWDRLTDTHLDMATRLLALPVEEHP